MNKTIYTLLFLNFILSATVVHAACATNPVIIASFTHNGKNYDFVKELKTWPEASSCAVQKGGYLAHIDSQTEQDVIYNAIVADFQESGADLDYHPIVDGGDVSYVWIGATDKNAEATWLWDGNNDDIGATFWTGQGATGNNSGTIVGGKYINWGGKNAGTIQEPDDYSPGQDAAAMALDGWPFGFASLGIAGEWNDIDASNTCYYVIEYDAIGIQPADKSENSIEIFPNPSCDKVKVTSDVGLKAITLSSMDGRIIKTLVSVNNKNVEIDLSLLNSGFYFLNSINDNNQRFVHKLIKE